MGPRGGGGVGEGVGEGPQPNVVQQVLVQKGNERGDDKYYWCTTAIYPV